MAWDFETDPEFEEKLEWIREFKREYIEPLDLVFPGRQFDPLDDETRPLVEPLKQRVKDEGLWAAHLGPELGGKGFGQVKLALMNEILGTTQWAPVVFGTNAPDTGNAEIIAHYGTEEQKAKWLQPLLDGECFSAYSMTEPTAGSDPKMFTTRAVRDGDEWVINGTKYFSSNARNARFVIVMAVTNPDVNPYKGMSMFLVPTDAPGFTLERNIGVGMEPAGEGNHALIQYDDVRVPLDSLLGGEGDAFVIAQTRLGGGRVHHAMRTVGVCQRALDMMCERVLSRETQGGLLAEKQMVQSDLADSYADLMQFRLMVLYTAWKIDRYQDYKRVRQDIATIKFLTPKVMQDVVWRAMHVHGALGASDEMPFVRMWAGIPSMAAVDGPTEVHKITVARELLKGYRPSPGLWPTEFLPTRRDEARAHLAAQLEHEIANS
jgi:acyl-CoA dehydrogenase